MTSALPSEAASDRRSIPSLDGLRAVAVGGVIVTHVTTIHMDGSTGGRVTQILGAVGVDVFFVISGFLITTLLLREIDEHGTIRLGRFVFRRVLRIFPPFYVYLACCMLADRVEWIPPVGRIWPAWAYVSNFVATGHWITGHSWSLSVEEQFYLSWPTLLATTRRVRAASAVLVLCVVLPFARVAVGYLFHDRIVGPLWGFEFLAAGCLVALAPAWIRPALAWTSSRGWLVALGAAFFVAGQAVFVGATRLRFVVQLLAVDVPGAACLAVAVIWCVRHPTSAAGRVLNSRPLRVVGVGSYSVYLWQQVFLAGETRTLLPLYGSLFGIVAASLLSYLLVERPSLALRGKIERRVWPSADISSSRFRRVV